MKFAMIPINRRYNDKNERVIRRVLISYTRKVKGVYKGTKLVDKDPYFNDPNSSQQYVFTDDYFYLISNAYDDDSFANALQNALIEEKRPYEYDAGKLIETAVEFTAKDLQEAMEMFHNRVEVH